MRNCAWKPLSDRDISLVCSLCSGCVIKHPGLRWAQDRKLPDSEQEVDGRIRTGAHLGLSWGDSRHQIHVYSDPFPLVKAERPCGVRWERRWCEAPCVSADVYRCVQEGWTVITSICVGGERGIRLREWAKLQLREAQTQGDNAPVAGRSESRNNSCWRSELRGKR